MDIESNSDFKINNNTLDRVFGEKLPVIRDFEFNEQVANAFDDMVSRSVPFYHEIHGIILDILDRIVEKRPASKPEASCIYDLGCSTGTTLSLIYRHFAKKKIARDFKFIGVDNSVHMIKKCREKMLSTRVKNFELICDRIENVTCDPAMMVIMNYTLQFIDVKDRLLLLKKIHQGLEKGGVLILSEKIKSDDRDINNFLTDLYYDFKRRNGYSELEISQKREALENVLIPLPPEKQISLLKEAGFKTFETIFRWYNFACFIGIKQ